MKLLYAFCLLKIAFTLLLYGLAAIKRTLEASIFGKESANLQEKIKRSFELIFFRGNLLYH